MYHIESDIQKAQLKTNLYLTEYGHQGAFHLAREIIQNNIDECLDDNSQGNTIEISYDKATDILTCEDNGRGFNEDKYDLSIFCTTMQSGSKFFRTGSADSAGEFGIGLTIVNALSDVFIIESFREKENTHHSLEYHEGVLYKESKTTLKGNKKHGTIVKFKASPKYLGVDCELPIEDVIKWLDDLFYLNSEKLLDKNISCKLTIYDGFKVISTHKFKPQPFYKLLEKLIPNNFQKKDLSTMISLSGNTIFVEKSKLLKEEKDGTKNVEIVPTEKNIHMDIAFQYCVKADYNEPAIYDTYCNYANTINNGVHLVAFEEVFCRLMQNKCYSTMSDSQKDKLKITWDDIRNNLFCVINLSSNASVGFVGNQKQAIGNKDLIPYMKELITKLLNDYFSQNQQVATELVKIVKLNAKTRLEVQKVKTASQVEKLNTFREHQMQSFIRCNNTGKQWKELFLCEGNSASSGLRNACDPDTQAIFMLRGVVHNSVKADSFAKTMENQEFKNLVTVLKCGAGSTFNLDKLYFNRINIFTDADVDGYYISSGLLAFIYMYMRPIIESGKLYKVFSPLYSLNDSEYKFAMNKSDLIDIYHKKIVKTYKIKPIHSDSYMSKSELHDFLIDTYKYKNTLLRASDESGKVNKFLVEMIIAFLSMANIVEDENTFKDLNEVFSNQKFIKSIMSQIQKKFKEITVDNSGRFSGVIDGKYSVIQVNKRFFKKTSSLIPIYKKYGLILTVVEKDKAPVNMTIGEFLDNCNKLMPDIVSRFKGLGEVNANQLKSTSMDINHRVSVQFTVDDVERELKIFNLTHGGTKDNMKDRKEMMKKYKIKHDDLDN